MVAGPTMVVHTAVDKCGAALGAFACISCTLAPFASFFLLMLWLVSKQGRVPSALLAFGPGTQHPLA